MKLTKKQQIDQKATELFWKHGFKKVTIDEICKKAGVSRKTFYTFYENKNALILYLYTKQIDDTYALYAQIMESDLPFADRLEKLINYKLEATKDISLDFISDFYNPEGGELVEFYNSTIERSLKFIREFFQKAMDKGEMNPDLNLDYVIYLLQKAIELCGTDELRTMFPDGSTMTRQVTQSIIYGIMPVKSKLFV